MAPWYLRFIYRGRKQYTRIYALPVAYRYIIGIFIILLGLVNLLNPFVNGVFLILLGSSLLSISSYCYLKKKRHVFKLKHDYHKRFPKKKGIKKQSSL